MSRLGCLSLLSRTIPKQKDTPRYMLINMRFHLADVRVYIDDDILEVHTPFGLLSIHDIDVGISHISYTKRNKHLIMDFSPRYKSLTIRWRGPRIRIMESLIKNQYVYADNGWTGLHPPIIEQVPAIWNTQNLYNYFWVVWKTIYRLVK